MSTATVTRRGTTNGNARGSTEDRRRRREWLVATYRADEDLLRVWWAGDLVPSEHPYSEHVERLADRSERVPAARCYRCGDLLSVHTVTVDRIIPGCKGGTYRRDNIRPACGGCNSETGGALASRPGGRR